MDSSWAPQSPDLSSYYAAPEPAVHPQHSGYRGSVSFTPPSSSPTLHAKPPAPPAHMPRAHHGDYVPDASLAAPMPDPADAITIKNHFPVARIKRIMQADDDVGKVAQVTPVVVSKALELFMISLVTKAAAEAKLRNSKRVGAVHLKQAVTKNEQFDFLNEIVAKVADAPDKSDGDAMDVDGKKKKAPSRRKKKTDDDDDF